MIVPVILFLIGFILIVKGGDLFVDSSINIAKASGLPEILIGATIVSIATTLPEVTVSVTASLKGHTTMSLGNAVGSIICNTGLILGIVNTISPSKINGKLFSVKAFIMFLYTTILVVFSLDRVIGKLDCIILLALLLVYMFLEYYILKHSKKQRLEINKYKLNIKEKLKIGINFSVGILFIIIGANLLINNGVVLAEYMGIPKGIISLTLIALGTSLPELVTSITSLIKGHYSLSIGNILGANILNIVMVIGLSGFIKPISILGQTLLIDYPIAIILMVVLVFPSLIIKKVSKIQGILLIVIYISYLFILYKMYM